MYIIYIYHIIVVRVYRFLQSMAPGAVCDLRIEQDGAYGAFCQVFSSLEVPGNDGRAMAEAIHQWITDKHT